MGDHMSTISASTTTTTAYVVTADTTGALVLQTGATPTTAVTVDTSQNVGVGVTPSAWGSGWKALQVTTGLALYNNAGDRAAMANNAYFNGTNWTYATTGYATRYEQQSGAHAWYTAGSGSGTISWSQPMTLDASGNLVVGKTNASATNQGAYITPAGTFFSAGNGTGTNYHGFFTNNANATPVTVGYISSSGTTTSYATSSDYRLKENVQPMTGALNKVAALKPVTYKWKTDGSNGEGFIAHELAEICSHAVTGEKDAVDADGNPQYQGIDVSFLVATLTAAIQEQQALITQLQADVAALKGN
jgi:hypothetical protein